MSSRTRQINVSDIRTMLRPYCSPRSANIDHIMPGFESIWRIIKSMVNSNKKNRKALEIDLVNSRGFTIIYLKGISQVRSLIGNMVIYNRKIKDTDKTNLIEACINRSIPLIQTVSNHIISQRLNHSIAEYDKIISNFKTFRKNKINSASQTSIISFINKGIHQTKELKKIDKIQIIDNIIIGFNFITRKFIFEQSMVTVRINDDDTILVNPSTNLLKKSFIPDIELKEDDNIAYKAEYDVYLKLMQYFNIQDNLILYNIMDIPQKKKLKSIARWIDLGMEDWVNCRYNAYILVKQKWPHLLSKIEWNSV